MTDFSEVTERAIEFRARNRLPYPTSIASLVLASHRLGVQVEYDATMVETGLLTTGQESPTIRLRENLGERRQKFALAHEIGHLLLRRAGTSYHPDEEKWCDRFAAEVLMPRDKWRQTPSGGMDSLGALVERSQAAGTSVAASFVRCRELFQWNAALITFRKDGSRWRVTGSLNLPSWLAAQLRSTPALGGMLDRTPLGISDVGLDLGVGPHSARVDAEALRGRSTAQVLLHDRAVSQLRKAAGSNPASVQTPPEPTLEYLP